MSLRWNCSVERGSSGAGSSGGAASSPARTSSVLDASSTIWSWSTEPAAAITIEPGT